MNSMQITSPLHQAFGQYSDQCSVLVMGLGESGQAMAKWSLSQGAKVVMHDTREESNLSAQVIDRVQELLALGVSRITFGPQLLAIDCAEINLIAMSPGISPIDPIMAPFITTAQEQQIAIWGELDFFSHALRSLEMHQQYTPKVIAITGTNGKTTTTALTGVICAKSGKTVGVAGNISPSLLDKLMTCLLQNNLPDIWVLELSSYQLYYSQDFNPHAATILNISEDHLDWHGSMEHYVNAKAKIFGPNTIPVINRDDARVLALIPEADWAKKRIISFGIQQPLEADSFGIKSDMGGAIDWLAWAPPVDEFNGNQTIKVRRTKKSQAAFDEEPLLIKHLIPAEALLIKGRHNASNALAALALANAVGLGIAQLLHGLRDYTGEPHRVQTIAIVGDVEYIDDSKGTNVGAVIAALQGLGMVDAKQGLRKILLIAGGDGKGQDFSPLREPILQYVKHLFLIGRDASQIAQLFAGQTLSITMAASLEDAVLQAASTAVAGDRVLLSPACASFDMFKNYQHRAEVFVNAVEELSINSFGAIE
ncbi:UDP-N-acetylmuramoylalanine--D-glutamate ligase [Polynucleobacter kasalickyi]|uniref:UDP-N-acetylmuramoylalanine--D-glutamate ligase n=2 Tax=Polynucleobacter kasalickyi TaxID=1938817 RepID=A0A1W2AE27_9BURK|nr:UDP-N-acetylmuramoylalanine--D-glutamate ligase [Polynucleobacter kasalickyi]